MSFLRRILGIFVMIAGVIGLILSLVGLVGVFVAKPVISSSINSTIDTLVSSVDTSQKTLDITYDALGATVNSVNALASMLDSTALTVEDTLPAIEKNMEDKAHNKAAINAANSPIKFKSFKSMYLTTEYPRILKPNQWGKELWRNSQLQTD